MKKRYVVVLLIAIVAIIGIMTYETDIVTTTPTGEFLNRSYKWSFTGQSFITTYTDRAGDVKGAKMSHACLVGNDESCFQIVVRSGNYASYFNAFRIAMFEQMMQQTGSTVTQDDLLAQLKAGFHEVLAITGTQDMRRHLVDIGMEAQHLYLERPRGTIILTDTLGLK